jgi:hypothetical protein
MMLFCIVVALYISHMLCEKTFIQRSALFMVVCITARSSGSCMLDCVAYVFIQKPQSDMCNSYARVQDYSSYTYIYIYIYSIVCVVISHTTSCDQSTGAIQAALYCLIIFFDTFIISAPIITILIHCAHNHIVLLQYNYTQHNRQ